jgi:hypothetical protein
MASPQNKSIAMFLLPVVELPGVLCSAILPKVARKQ